MKQLTHLLCLTLVLLLSTGCQKELQPEMIEELEVIEDYTIAANGDLQMNIGDQTKILEINALPDSHILEDEDQRLLILSDPNDDYQHGILGDDLEASSVTLIQLSDAPAVISHFSVPEAWVIESIVPIWSDWDGDGEREILLTLSNSTNGAKLALYDEKGHLLAESMPIGQGSRWRHALAIASFGENGEKLLVDVETPHIGGIVGFYRWDKDTNLLEREATLSGYSTHDIGSRVMGMYALMMDEEKDQVLLILPNQSKTELAALRFVSGVILEEWRLPLGGKLSGDIDLIEENGGPAIRAIIDNHRQVVLTIPE